MPQGQVWNNSTLNPSAIYSQPVNQLQHYAQSKFMGPIPAASFALAPLPCPPAPLPLAGPISTVVPYASVASCGTKGSSVIPDIDMFASLSADQAARLCKRACRWQDSDALPGVMISKSGDILTQKILQKMIVKLAEPILGLVREDDVNHQGTAASGCAIPKPALAYVQVGPGLLCVEN